MKTAAAGCCFHNCLLQLDLITDSVKTKIIREGKGAIAGQLDVAGDFLGCEGVRNQSCLLMCEERM